MADERIRIEIAFVDETTADKLEQAIGDDRDGAFALPAEDGRYTVSLRRVVYVKRFVREGRVGFTPA